MFSSADYEKLQQIMAESPEKKELLSHLLASHQMTLSTISHELRNPLTLIYSTLQLIESQHPEVFDFRYWSDMRKDIEYMKLLLEELSTYNNSERINLTRIDSNTFFKTIVLSFAASLIETDIDFVSKIEPNLTCIQGDYIKLREVFLNLLGNARDAVTTASLTNDRKPQIQLSITQNNDFIQIVIRDNGCGISKEQLPHIFEPFVTYKKNGTGLGLAIASRIIKAHLGTIQVSSVLNVHTTFTLTLPVQKNS